MQLNDWLEKKRMKRTVFADAIHVSPSYITALCSGDAWPGREIAANIVAVTGGKVSPNDFLAAKPPA